ncbi:hypothetical protein CL617_01485 [archaeon]|nr:hypothetical protein [archaeon]|tara:strand:- start:4969 stop:5769 length:801 start_codon:yes stop_codon:yes gene_type:complete
MFKNLARKFPELKLELIQTNIKKTPEEFVKSSFTLALIATIVLIFVLVLVLLKIDKSLVLALLALPVFFILFLFFIKSPKVKAKKEIREIDKEIVYAGRFMLIELSSGIPLYGAMLNVSNVYKKIGKHFRGVTDRVEIGKPMETAINEVIEITPSPNFRKMLWQILNSLKTGSNVSVTLKSILDQISKEQLLEIKAYGKKLNPMVMFYLMLAVIAPSLGVAMLSLLSSFIGLALDFNSLLGIGVGIAILQLTFLSAIKSSRPGVEL